VPELKWTEKTYRPETDS